MYSITNDDFLPDIILLTDPILLPSGNLIVSHEEFLSVPTMFPPNLSVLTTFPPDWLGLGECSEGVVECVQIFL